MVVGQSFGAFTAPLVAERLDADAIVLVAGMVPAPGERPDDWWEHVGYAEAVATRGETDGPDRVEETEDPFTLFYADVPRALAAEALGHERAHPSPAAGSAPWPLAAWPRARVTSVVCARDRFLPPDLQRRLARERLGRGRRRDRQRPLPRAEPAARAGGPPRARRAGPGPAPATRAG